MSCKVLPIELRQLIGSYWPNNIMVHALVTIVLCLVSKIEINDSQLAMIRRMIKIVNETLIDNGFRSSFEEKDGKFILHQDYSQFIDYNVFVALINLARNTVLQQWLVARLNMHWKQNGSNRRLVLTGFNASSNSYEMVQIK